MTQETKERQTYWEGTIVRLDGKMCLVHREGQTHRAYIKKNIRGARRDELKPIAVGDLVLFEARNENEVLIHEVLPRRTWLERSSVKKNDKKQVLVSNVSQLLIITSLQSPPFNQGIVDRLLVAAHQGKLLPLIVLNKIDLQEQEPLWGDVQKTLDGYRRIGYEVIFTSVLFPDSLIALKERLKGQSSVCAGHSGVGKSSLISAIDPRIKLTTTEVNPKSGKGRHTTTSVSLLPLCFGGFIVDTPGVREFGIWKIEESELSRYFPEFEPLSCQCKYKGCTHTHEPHCAVKDALENQEIESFRYEGYCKILESIKQEKLEENRR